jgi:hypothetical protein
MRIFRLAGAVLLAVGTSARGASPTIIQPRRPHAGEGCYRADRPLGTSAGSALGRGIPAPYGARIGEDSASLSSLTTFRLLPAGLVARPETFLHAQWARGSRWTSSGDSLDVTLSTGTSGWALRLARVEGTGDVVYKGAAQYLTDVIVRDSAAWLPPRYLTQVRQERCVPPDASRALKMRGDFRKLAALARMSFVRSFDVR